MKLKSLVVATLTLGTTLAVSLNAQAHSVWLAKVYGEQTVMYGHSPVDTDSYDPAKVEEVKGLKNGEIKTLNITPHDSYASIDTEKVGIISLVMNNGFWCQDNAGKWFNQPKNEVKDAKECVNSIKYSIGYLNNREKPNALGLGLEIVPDQNPAKLKKGDQFSIQVLWNGQPLPEAKVTGDMLENEQHVTTDAQGKATLSVGHQSFNLVEVSHSVPFDNTELADTLSLSSTLSFTAKHQHH